MVKRLLCRAAQVGSDRRIGNKQRWRICKPWAVGGATIERDRCYAHQALEIEAHPRVASDGRRRVDGDCCGYPLGQLVVGLKIGHFADTDTVELDGGARQALGRQI